MKLADATPVFTKNGRLTKTFGGLHPFLKFLKKLIQKQINQHIINQLSPYLCRYGKGVGTHALLLLIERWIKIFDDKSFGKIVLTIFF